MTNRSLSHALALVALTSAFVACAPASGRSQREPGPTLTSDDVRNSSLPVEVMLQRKVPGLVVTRTPSGELALQIRGSKSFTGDNRDPLYILNGSPFKPGAGGALTGINPDDIDTVRVLKGPEATIYGMDGANGVILITTKMGRKDKNKSKDKS